MNNQENLSVLIKLRGEGMELIDQLIGDMGKAGAKTGEFRQKADELNGELQRLEQQQGLIESFRKSKERVDEAAVAYAAAQQRAQQLGREMAQLENPTRQQQAAFAKARNEVNQAGAAYQGARLGLQNLRSAMGQAGMDTGALAGVQVRVRRETEALRGSIDNFAGALRASAAAAGQSATAGEKMVRTHRKIGEGVDSISLQLAALKTQMMGLVGVSMGGSMIRDALATADAYKNLHARIQLVAGEGLALQQAFDGVTGVALRTHSALETTGNLFARLAKTGKDAGLSVQAATEQALGLTETINQAVQLSGASAAASDAAITQLIQGLQSGVFRGDEFNSVMEQSPRLAQAMADGLKVTTGELRNMAQDGKLTTEVVTTALKGQSEAIAAEFAKLPPTVGRAVQDLNTNWTLYIGKTDEAKGASAAVAGVISALSNNLTEVADALFVAGKAWAGYKALGMAQHFLEMARNAGAAAAANMQSAATAGNAAAANARVAATAGHAAAAQNQMAAAGKQVAASNQVVATTGAQAAAANTSVATTAGLAARAKAAFSQTSAQAMGLVTTGVQALVGALSLLKNFAFVAILTNLPEIGQWIADTAAKITGLTGKIKKYEEAMQHAEIRAKAQADFMREYNLAMQAATDKTQGISKETRELANAFVAARKEGKGVKEALNEIQKTLDASNYKSLNDFRVALNELQATSKITADQVSARWADILSGKAFSVDSAQGIVTAARLFGDLQGQGVASARVVQEAWSKALKGEDLLLFEIRAREAFQAGQLSAAQLQQAIDQGLRESIRRAGVDFDAISGGMGQAAALAVNDLDALAGHIGRLKDVGVDTGKALAASIGKALSAADSKAAVDAVVLQIERVRAVLGNKVADGFLDQAKEKMLGLQDASDRATGGINSVREAMKALGITSDADLKQAAKTAKEAYDTIAESGKASQRELAEAWKKMADAAIAANEGVASATIKAQATVHGYVIAVDEAGKAAIRTLQQVKEIEEKKGAERESGRGIDSFPQENGDTGKNSGLGKSSDPTDDYSARLAARNANVKSILADRPAQQGTAMQLPPDFWGQEPGTARATAASGPAPDVPQAVVQQQWQGAWENRPAQSPTGAAERTVRVNLNLGGQALGDVQTDEAGAAAIERLLRTLEDGMRQSGGSRRF